MPLYANSPPIISNVDAVLWAVGRRQTTRECMVGWRMKEMQLTHCSDPARMLRGRPGDCYAMIEYLTVLKAGIQRAETSVRCKGSQTRIFLLENKTMQQ